MNNRVVCPDCNSSVRERDAHRNYNDCPCPYVDVVCELGHVNHTISGTTVMKPGPTHQAGAGYDFSIIPWWGWFIFFCVLFGLIICPK